MLKEIGQSDGSSQSAARDLAPSKPRNGGRMTDREVRQNRTDNPGVGAWVPTARRTGRSYLRIAVDSIADGQAAAREAVPNDAFAAPWMGFSNRDEARLRVPESG
jgi:hypothetical protein